MAEGERRGGEVVARGAGGPAVQDALGFDAGQRGEAGQARLVRMAAVGEEPAGVVAYPVAAGLDPAVIGVGGLEGGEGLGRVGEEGFDLAHHRRPFGPVLEPVAARSSPLSAKR